MIVLLRGGGDLASGVAIRLFRAGLQVVIVELPEPHAIRRMVSFAEAAYSAENTVEEVTANRVGHPEEIKKIKALVNNRRIPVVLDPDGRSISLLHPSVLIDARMLKQAVPYPDQPVPLVIGLGPGFEAGVNCHALVETQRGHTLGRVYWQGSGLLDTGIPDAVMGITNQRLLRSPAAGIFHALAEIGDRLVTGQPVADISGVILRAPFAGVLRGILYSGLHIPKDFKVGDLDPRNDPRLCTLVSDKALAVGGGVMEAILSRPELRKRLWE